MNIHAKKLATIIEKELVATKASFKGYDKTALLELCRCHDYFFAGASYVLPEKGDQIKAYRPHFALYAVGWYDTLRIFTPSSDGTTMFMMPTSNTNRNWAEKTLRRLGMVGNLQRINDLAHYDVFDCEFDGKNAFTFIPRENAIGIEYLETQNQRWLAQYNYDNSDRSNQATWRGVVNTQMFGLVTVYNDAFIKYTPTPIIEKYYSIEGRQYIESKIGYDYYPAYVTFGGITFGDYLSVIACLVGKALMHRDFCFRAQEKTNFKTLDSYNLYTTIERRDNLCEFITNITGLPRETVESILNTVVMTRQKLDEIYFPSGYSPPALIQFNDQDLLFTLSGHLANPLTYLNRCLRHYFPDDYSSGVNEREKHFRAELYSWFDQSILKIPNGIKLKVKNKLYTDIDAILFDKKDNILILFQLKFMEDWATDMKQRDSMMGNFRKSINKYINGVHDFIVDHGETELLKRFSNKQIKPGCTIYKIVIGKHFSQFTGLPMPSEYIFANWATLVRTLIQNTLCSKSLKLLIEELQTNNVNKSLTQLQAGMTDDFFKVGRTAIRVKLQ